MCCRWVRGWEGLSKGLVELSGSKVVVRSEEVRENLITLNWDFIEQEQIIVRHERSKSRS